MSFCHSRAALGGDRAVQMYLEPLIQSMAQKLTEVSLLTLFHSRAAPGGDRVVQKYVERPVTVDGAKFDLRVYLAVRSVSPVEAFLFTGWCAIFGTCGTASSHEAMS